MGKKRDGKSSFFWIGHPGARLLTCWWHLWDVVLDGEWSPLKYSVLLFITCK